MYLGQKERRSRHLLDTPKLGDDGQSRLSRLSKIFTITNKELSDCDEITGITCCACKQTAAARGLSDR